MNPTQLAQHLQFSQALEQALQHANEAIDLYNQAQAEAAKFADEVADEMFNFYEEQTEEWQESEAGHAYQHKTEIFSNYPEDPEDELADTSLAEFLAFTEET